MSESALPPCDRSEEPDPPQPGEKRSAWIKRLACTLWGHDIDHEATKVLLRRKGQSQDERTDLILRGIDPDAREAGEEG